MIKDVSINRTIYSSKRVIISAQSNVVILISKSRKALNLLNNRDLLFESQILNVLLMYVYIVNYEVSKIFVRNNSNKFITLSQKQKLKRIINYNVSSYYYVIQLNNHILVVKLLKR